MVESEFEANVLNDYILQPHFQVWLLLSLPMEIFPVGKDLPVIDWSYALPSAQLTAH